MDYRAVFQISAAGMMLEKRRVEVAALNLANMHASAPPGQPPFSPQRLAAEPVPLNFSRALSAAMPLAVPRKVQLVSSTLPARLVHEPGHPHADSKGFVAYSPVDQSAEMIAVSTALRAYEANIAVASSARAMAAKALELGGQ
jgi:flagellar basal-body rod protein FlgC